jgi:hypothetical protein
VDAVTSLIYRLLRERFGIPPDAEVSPAAESSQSGDDEPTEIARRRRVLWFGMSGKDAAWGAAVRAGTAAEAERAMA